MGWYVVQTMAGQERKVQSRISQKVIRGRETAFVFDNERMYRIKGEWIKDRKPLFPGYLFVTTDEPESFDARLRNEIHGRSLLKVDGRVMPIRAEEEEYLKRIGGDEHVARFSEGYRIGDRVEITRGAFAGYNGVIKKLDRHNREAKIILSLFGRGVEVDIGLAIVKSYADQIKS